MVIYDYPCNSTEECHPIEVKLKPGFYLFECYGAQGGTGLLNAEKTYPGGKGAYTSGFLNLYEEKTFFLYIGGKGQDGVNDTTHKAPGGWNGGGRAGNDIRDNDGSGGGGGATDIRLLKGKWDESTSLRSRIMVAAGGSGSASGTYGGPGGDLFGYRTLQYDIENYTKSQTCQTQGNSFGVGANGKPNENTPDSGGGGGYYGGNVGDSVQSASGGYYSVSSSGSSFVSGYKGCDAVDENGNHTGLPYHYGGIIFADPKIYNGFTKFPSPAATLFVHKTEVGHPGNGLVKITLIHFNCSHKRNLLYYPHIFFVVFLIGN